METLIWGFGSMVVLLLIILVLPLGFSIKGKLLVALTSFFLALGGLAAYTVVPFWETALLLIILIFMISYVMQRRLGKLFLKENSSYVEELIIREDVETTKDFSHDEIENIESKIDKYTPKLGQVTMEIVQESSDVNHSFLLDEENYVEHELESSYLSDIEHILEEKVNQYDMDPNDNWLNELIDMHDPSINKYEEKNLDKPTDFSIATKEVAVGKEIEIRENLAEIVDK
jgi:hypothetical protein